MPIVFFLFLSTRRHPLAMSKVTTKLLAALLAMIALNTIVLTGVMFLGLAAIDEMEIHFQPIFEIETEAPVFAEALPRWNSLDLGLVAPDEFIRVAEDLGEIERLLKEMRK